MKKEELLKFIAPCGLVCYTCDHFQSGVINEAAKRLLYVLESYDRFLKEHPASRPISGRYDDFQAVLEYLANVECKGCRESKCMGSECFVAKCVKEKQVDFCYECREFPCDKTGFEDDLKQKWLSKNNRIKTVGMEQYFKEEKEIPHYSS